jgi:hypothetical protein
MNNDNVELTFDKELRLLDELQSLLAKQLQLARQGDSTNERFGVLIDKAGSLLEEIEQTGILDSAELQYRREALQKRYENLCLIVATQKNHRSRELNQIRRGRKILGTYRSNI